MKSQSKFIHFLSENLFENGVWKMASILSRPQYDKSRGAWSLSQRWLSSLLHLWITKLQWVTQCQLPQGDTARLLFPCAWQDEESHTTMSYLIRRKSLVIPANAWLESMHISISHALNAMMFSMSLCCNAHSQSWFWLSCVDHINSQINLG